MKVYTCFPGGKAKALTMSYDDGKVQDRRLIDICNKYGIKGTFNLNYGQVGKRPRMTFEEMEGLYAGQDRKSTRLNSSHSGESRMPSSA